MASYTKRSIINISLSKIKTNQELMDIMFDQKFAVKDEDMPVKMAFGDVIFVMEDVDAASKIVHKRKKGGNKPKSTVVTTTKQVIEGEQDGTQAPRLGESMRVACEERNGQLRKRRLGRSTSGGATSFIMYIAANACVISNAVNTTLHATCYALAEGDPGALTPPSLVREVSTTVVEQKSKVVRTTTEQSNDGVADDSDEEEDEEAVMFKAIASALGGGDDDSDGKDGVAVGPSKNPFGNKDKVSAC